MATEEYEMMMKMLNSSADGSMIDEDYGAILGTYCQETKTADEPAEARDGKAASVLEKAADFGGNNNNLHGGGVPFA